MPIRDLLLGAREGVKVVGVGKRRREMGNRADKELDSLKKNINLLPIGDIGYNKDKVNHV